MCVGGIRMSTIATSGRVERDPPQELVGRARLADDVEPGLHEQALEPLAQEGLVIGDHDAHGTSARNRIPPVPAVDGQAAVERAEPVAQRDEVGLGAVPGLDLDDQHAFDPVGPYRDSAPRRPRDLGNDRVGRRLDRRREPAVREPADRHRHARLLRKRLDRRADALVGEDGREEPVRELAQILDRGAQLGVRLLERGGRLHAGREPRAHEPERQGESDEALLGAVVQVPLEPAPLGIGGVDDAGAGAAELFQPRRDLRVQALVLEGEPGGGAGLGHELRVVQEPRRVREHGDRAVVLDERRARRLGGKLDGSPLCVDEPVGALERIGHHERRVVDDLGEHVAEAAGWRRLGQVDDQARDVRARSAQARPRPRGGERAPTSAAAWASQSRRSEAPFARALRSSDEATKAATRAR